MDETVFIHFKGQNGILRWDKIRCTLNIATRWSPVGVDAQNLVGSDAASGLGFIQTPFLFNPRVKQFCDRKGLDTSWSKIRFNSKKRGMYMFDLIQETNQH